MLVSDSVTCIPLNRIGTHAAEEEQLGILCATHCRLQMTVFSRLAVHVPGLSAEHRAASVQATSVPQTHACFRAQYKLLDGQLFDTYFTVMSTSTTGKVNGATALLHPHSSTCHSKEWKSNQSLLVWALCILRAPAHSYRANRLQNFSNRQARLIRIELTSITSVLFLHYYKIHRMSSRSDTYNRSLQEAVQHVLRAVVTKAIEGAEFTSPAGHIRAHLIRLSHSAWHNKSRFCVKVVRSRELLRSAPNALWACACSVQCAALQSTRSQQQATTNLVKSANRVLKHQQA